MSGSLLVRYLGSRALDTTNTVRSSARTLLNLGRHHAVNSHLTFGLDVFNRAGRRGDDIAYHYAY